MSDTVPALSRVVVNPELIPRLLPLALLYARRDAALAEFDVKAAQDRAALVADFDAQAARLREAHGIVFLEQVKSAATRGAGAVASVVDLATPRPDRPKAKRQKETKRRAPWGENAARILEVLRRDPESPKRHKDFAHLGLSPSSFSIAIQRLQKEGRVLREGQGPGTVYRLPVPEAPKVPASAAVVANVEAVRTVRAARQKDKRISPTRFYHGKILEQLRYRNQDMDTLAAALGVPPKRLCAPLSKLIREGKITHSVVNGKPQYALAAGGRAGA